MTGKRLWRFYTIPGPGEFGNDTWKGDSWKTGGGGTWLTGTYDPELDTLYWPIGNPAAMTDRSVRGDGDNLFTDSVVALDPDTGRRKWHYQFTPNDGHDWDSTEDMVLVDRMWRGQHAEAAAARRSQRPLLRARSHQRRVPVGHAVHPPDLEQGLRREGPADAGSRIELEPEGQFPRLSDARRRDQLPGAVVQSDHRLVLSGVFGGRRAVRQRAAGAGERQEYLGNAPNAALRRRAARTIRRRMPGSRRSIRRPERPSGTSSCSRDRSANGVLATAGGVLFASSRDGNIIALDAKTGKHLWHYQTGGNHAASPISYAIDGRQYVALTAGNVLYSFALPE